MVENDFKFWLKPIHTSVEKLVPTNRSLIDFVNEKALGSGIKRSLFKVKFIDKSEKSTYQCINVVLSELKKKLSESKVTDEDSAVIMERATSELEEAKEQVSKVFAEVRRYVVTSELRTGCVQHHYKKIPSMSEAQNEALSKEMFSMALEFVNKSDQHSIDDVEEEFERINRIAINLFNIVEATAPKKKEAAGSKSREAHSYNPLSLLGDLW